jgi:hypothetical protein
MIGEVDIDLPEQAAAVAGQVAGENAGRELAGGANLGAHPPGKPISTVRPIAERPEISNGRVGVDQSGHSISDSVGYLGGRPVGEGDRE